MSKLLTPEKLEKLFAEMRDHSGREYWTPMALIDHIKALTERYDEACDKIFKDAVELSRQDEEIERLKKVEEVRKGFLCHHGGDCSVIRQGNEWYRKKMKEQAEEIKMWKESNHKNSALAASYIDDITELKRLNEKVCCTDDTYFLQKEVKQLKEEIEERQRTWDYLLAEKNHLFLEEIRLRVQRNKFAQALVDTARKEAGRFTFCTVCYRTVDDHLPDCIVRKAGEVLK